MKSSNYKERGESWHRNGRLKRKCSYIRSMLRSIDHELIILRSDKDDMVQQHQTLYKLALLQRQVNIRTCTKRKVSREWVSLPDTNGIYLNGEIRRMVLR